VSKLNTKEFIERNKGKDKIIGRPVRLNRVTLKPKKGRNYAEIIFFGDIHLGYPTANMDEAMAMLDYCRKNGIYVHLLGDLIECGQRDSIGDSNYRQKLDPQTQMETIVEMLKPIANAGLVTGLHMGNHENRITLRTGIDISKIMARLLGVRYLGYSSWSLLQVGKIKYSLYSTHGKSGATQEYTKMNAVIKLAKITLADVVAYGHTHGLGSKKIITQIYDSKKNRIVHRKQMCCLSGAYMEWDDSYAQMCDYTIAEMGSPKAKLMADHKDVYFSF